MHIEGEKSKNIGLSSDIEIIGKGNIGEKARQFVQKTSFLKSIGFHVPKRTVLAQNFLDGFFQENGLGKSLIEVNPSSDLEAKIKQGQFSIDDSNALQEIFASYGNSPLIMRSSGEGDARGTGIYDSIFTENKVGGAITALKEVLSSYFSEDAIAFRKDAKTGEGFGIMIEPVIGQELGYCFAPILSGFGYTSTINGEGYTTIVPGLGCAVNSKGGEKIAKSQIEKHGGILESYLNSKILYLLRMSKIYRSKLLRLGDSEGEYNMRAFFPSGEYMLHAEVADTSLSLPVEIQEKLDNLNLLSLFSNMEQMEQNFGKPQYFEWAMTVESGVPIYWIIQIADVNKKSDLLDFEDFGKIMFTGHTVTGTGIRESSKIAFCWNHDNIDNLERFNKENKDYILMYSSRLTTSISAKRKLSYRFFNNASVLLEVQDAPHDIGDPIAHLGGKIAMTGKLFGVLDYHSDPPPDWTTFDRMKQSENGLTVCSGKFKTVAIEKKNRLILHNQE